MIEQIKLYLVSESNNPPYMRTSSTKYHKNTHARESVYVCEDGAFVLFVYMATRLIEAYLVISNWFRWRSLFIYYLDVRVHENLCLSCIIL
ncbi:Uncharacterized protein TCM_005301 [Theobroma cacao]|uniref:Uncharacterized protein n=1 Tax=Theobroma cacao TaxID=3641 RepID=A0A061E0W1_THECC|nr:Uncharacterized protein TCM_005301 [Theobroma cacao]